MNTLKKHYLKIKYLMDIVVSIILLVLLFPFLILISVIVLIDTHNYPFYKQTRVGKNNVEFEIYKFRTMKYIQKKYKLTKIGSLLRKYSVDEIPQLINVIKGDMSLIGPRPLLKKDFKKYYNGKFISKDVLPGITGLAQINGRKEISWEKRKELNEYYENNVSFLQDVYIVINTIKELFVKLI